MKAQGISRCILDDIKNIFTNSTITNPLSMKDDIDKHFVNKVRFNFKADCCGIQSKYNTLFIMNEELKVDKLIIRSNLECLNDDCRNGRKGVNSDHFTNISGHTDTLYIIFKDINENEKFVKFFLSINKNQKKPVFATYFFYFDQHNLLFMFPIDKSNKDSNYKEFKQNLDSKGVKFQDLRLKSAFYTTDDSNYDESIITDLPNYLKPDEIIDESNRNVRPNSNIISNSVQASPNQNSVRNTNSVSNCSNSTAPTFRQPNDGNQVLHAASVAIGADEVENGRDYSVFEKSFSNLSRKRIKLFSYKLDHKRENESNSKRCRCMKWNPKYLNYCIYCRSEVKFQEIS